LSGSTLLKKDLLDLADQYHDLEHFYDHQKPTWEKLRKAHTAFQLNRLELEKDAQAGPALKRMQEILSASLSLRTHQGSRRPHQHGQWRELGAAHRAADAGPRQDRRPHRHAQQGHRCRPGRGQAAVGVHQAAGSLKEQVQKEESLAHITQAEGEAVKVRAGHGGRRLHLVQPLCRHPLHGAARLSGPQLPGAEPPRRRCAPGDPGTRPTPRPARPGPRAGHRPQARRHPDEELYRICCWPSATPCTGHALPVRAVDDETELLLPDNLLQTDSLIRELVTAIPEEDWQEIEIIGWLYQFYISEKKDQVIGKVVKSEDIPAATQLFTPNWIVKYMVQNSLGAQWLATYPDSPLKGRWPTTSSPPSRPTRSGAARAITPSQLNPEELTLIDPACGSGHILVEAYDLFKAIYLERGYRPRHPAADPGEEPLRPRHRRPRGAACGLRADDEGPLTISDSYCPCFRATTPRRLGL
jgi:hypothetical protein